MEKNIILFILTFLVVFIIYEIMSFRNRINKKSKNVKKNSREILEIKLLKICFKVPVEKLRLGILKQVICFVSSIDIALIVTIACGITSIGLLQILIALVILLPILLGSYYLVSVICKFLIKKRSDKNE